LFCVLVGIDICEFEVRRGSAKRWAVDLEEGSWEAGIIEEEEDRNLPGEGGVARGEFVASAVDALSDKDCEFELSPDWDGEEADDDGKSVIVLAVISSGVGRSVTIGSLGVGSEKLDIVFLAILGELI